MHLNDHFCAFVAFELPSGGSMQRSAKIRFKPKTAREVANGAGGVYLDVDGIASQAGIAEYREGGKIVREYTPPEVLRDPDYLRALEGAPLTRRHPNMGLMGSLEQIRSNVIGTVRRATYDPQAKANRVTVRFFDPKVVLEDGFNALSVGYTADTDDRPGSVQGVGVYDRKQTKRTAVNHVASTDNPRYDGCRLDEKEPKMGRRATLERLIGKRLDELEDLIKQKESMPPEGEEDKEDEDGEDVPEGQLQLPMPKQDAKRKDADPPAPMAEDPNMLPPKADEYGPDGKPKQDADGEAPPVPVADPVEPAKDAKMPPPEKSAPKMDEAARLMRIGRLAERTGVTVEDAAKLNRVPVNRVQPGHMIRAMQAKHPDLDGGHVRTDEAVAYIEGRLAGGKRESVVASDVARTYRTDEAAPRTTYTGPGAGLLRGMK
jgi:hypothetical protein